MQRIHHQQLQIAKPLYDFINDQVIPNTGINAKHFWSALSDAATLFIPRNKVLLAKRQQLQRQIDQWHRANSSENSSALDYQKFLTSIGYLEPEAPEFKISTKNVDTEVAQLAGPQLVVPVMNARYALNATNARWGSLYDALYGCDVIPFFDGENLKQGFCQARGKRVIAYAKAFLDQAVPLAQGHYQQVTGIAIDSDGLHFIFKNGQLTTLKDISQFVGYQCQSNGLAVVLLKNNGLHIEIHLDANSVIGKMDEADIKDVVIEAALTTIQDCEDSIAAVDTADKILVYKNWLGLMKGDLQESFTKNNQQQTRQLASDRYYLSPLGEKFTLPGRSLLLVRNVGLLMTTDAVLFNQGGQKISEELPEGILDAFITSLIALHDIQSKRSNSSYGSIYIVKPKMHGSAEVAFSCDLFSAVEEALVLPPNTIKIGLMDEERRTSCNLKQCLYQARDRVAFINTGFMDRTGDEIHTSMAAGAMLRKEEMKQQPWLKTYETNNVNTGLAVGLRGKAQIGKGMWPVPDEMAKMMQQKVEHLKAGANCAWVPSPTAAILHAMHYHKINVNSVQKKLSTEHTNDTDDENLTALLSIPVHKGKPLSKEKIQQQLTNNIQGILGYVVRWVELGIGCSKVPDLNNVGLMEDRATLRISSQHIANWLMHDLVTATQVRQTLESMALVVDQQNIDVNGYQAMSGNFEQSYAFNAALDLIFKGAEQPSGYTEPLLHHYRKLAKQKYN